MPDDKPQEKDTKKEPTKDAPTSTRADRFIYTKEDAAHIFRLGKIGTVFNDTDDNKS
jgi:hypothetical protein